MAKTVVHGKEATRIHTNGNQGREDHRRECNSKSREAKTGGKGRKEEEFLRGRERKPTAASRNLAQGLLPPLAEGSYALDAHEGGEEAAVVLLGVDFEVVSFHPHGEGPFHVDAGEEREAALVCPSALLDHRSDHATCTFVGVQAKLERNGIKVSGKPLQGGGEGGREERSRLSDHQSDHGRGLSAQSDPSADARHVQSARS